jgi:hypothetical protein
VGEDPIEQNEQEGGVFLCGQATKPGRQEDGIILRHERLGVGVRSGQLRRSKTKSFKKKANATNSISNEFELGPEADTVLSEIESEDEEMIGLKRKKNSNVQTQMHDLTTCQSRSQTINCICNSNL